MHRHNKVLIAALAGAAVVASAALAQQAPESILPPGFGEAPQPTPTPSPSPTPSPAAPARIAPDTNQVVEAGPSTLTPEELALLSQPEFKPIELPESAERDPRFVGPLPASATGLGAQPWGGSSGVFLSRLMRRTQAPLASRWGHIMLRNSLLTQAEAPVGVNPADWVAERTWLLLRMGEADGARYLASGIDVRNFTPKMFQVAAQSALANADPSGLCPLRDGLQRPERRIGILVGAMCASLSGSSALAASDIESARRRGAGETIDIALADKVVGAGADTARSVTIEWKDVDRLNTWRFGLSAATGLMPPQPLLEGSPNRLRAWLARAPMLSATDRLASARIAAGLGVFSSQALLDLYSLIYDATDPSDLGSTDAWKLRQAFVGKDRETRLSAIRQLLTAAGNDPLQKSASWAMLGRAAMLVQPDSELQDIAPDLIAAMMAAGYDAEAARWGQAISDMDEAPRNRSWAMLALGAPEAGIDTDDLDDFISGDDSEGMQRSALLVAGLAGLGRIDSATANRLNSRYDLGLGRKTQWSEAIDTASRLRQPGTVALLAGMGLQGDPGGAISPMHLYHLVTALNRNGMGFMARMIAAEALARS